MRMVPSSDPSSPNSKLNSVSLLNTYLSKEVYQLHIIPDSQFFKFYTESYSIYFNFQNKQKKEKVLKAQVWRNGGIVTCTAVPLIYGSS
jgi:hypothetical protein